MCLTRERVCAFTAEQEVGRWWTQRGIFVSQASGCDKVENRYATDCEHRKKNALEALRRGCSRTGSRHEEKRCAARCQSDSGAPLSARGTAYQTAESSMHHRGKYMENAAEKLMNLEVGVPYLKNYFPWDFFVCLIGGGLLRIYCLRRDCQARFKNSLTGKKWIRFNCTLIRSGVGWVVLFVRGDIQQQWESGARVQKFFDLSIGCERIMLVILTRPAKKASSFGFPYTEYGLMFTVYP